MDLLRALLPASSNTRFSRRIAARNAFGAITVAAVLSTISAAGGLAKTVADLAPKINKILNDEDRKIREYTGEYKKAKIVLSRSKDKSVQATALQRMVQYEELMEVAKIRKELVRAGLVLPGPSLDGTAIEVRRNMLAEEWDTAEPARKAHIERLVVSYDKELASIERMVKQLQALERQKKGVKPRPESRQGSASAELILASDQDRVTPLESTENLYLRDQGGDRDPTGELDNIRSIQNLKAAILDSTNPIKPNQALVTGIGGQQFVAQAPMREVCIAMYPSRPADSYAGANGILVPGDDPVLLMRLTAGSNTNFLASTDYEISTELFDYGKYRVVGFMSHPQGNYQVRTATGAIRNTSQVNGVGIVIRSIQVYNGEELLLPLGDLDISTFSIFPRTDAYPGISSTSLSAFAQQAPYNERRSERFFVGLRTNPVIEGTARIRAIVRCFVYSTSNNPGVVPTGMLTGDTLEVPVSFSALSQMLEDKVFGNPVVPGPASRPGAQVMLGLRDLGTDSKGVKQLQLRNPRYTPPKITSED